MKIPLTITNEGLSALVDANTATTNSVRIAAIGLSAAPFIAAPTLTALPGEFKRLDGVGGEAAAENILHMTVEDGSDDAYSVTGIGVFLDNGVLFAVYSQLAEQGELFGKSSASTFLFAADVAFEADVANLVEFGDANFSYPPATETTKGVAFLATTDDMAAGTDGEKIVTPKLVADHFVPLTEKGAPGGVATLDATGKVPPSQLPAVDSIDTYEADDEAEMLALPATPGDFCRRLDESKTYVLRAAPATTLANWAEFLSPGAPVRTVNGKIGDVVLNSADVGAAPATRQVTGGGLVTGGGSLVGDRQLTVAIATAAETLAGLINDKAVTPAALASVLAQLAATVPSTRHVDTSGLATGGGALDADRTINVPKATAADVEGLTNDTKAVTAAALAGTLRSMTSTGFLRIPGTPLILQWGYNNVPTSGVRNVTFPIAFPTQCFQTMMTPYSDPDDGDESDEIPFVTNQTQTGFNCRISGDNKLFYFGFLSLGI